MSLALCVARAFVAAARLILTFKPPCTQILDIATGTVARTLPGVSVFFWRAGGSGGGAAAAAGGRRGGLTNFGRQ